MPLGANCIFYAGGSNEHAAAAATWPLLRSVVGLPAPLHSRLLPPGPNSLPAFSESSGNLDLGCRPASPPSRPACSQYLFLFPIPPCLETLGKAGHAPSLPCSPPRTPSTASLSLRSWLVTGPAPGVLGGTECCFSLAARQLWPPPHPDLKH